MTWRGYPLGGVDSVDEALRRFHDDVEELRMCMQVQEEEMDVLDRARKASHITACDCGVMAYEVAQHRATCRYRTLFDATNEIAALRESVTKLLDKAVYADEKAPVIAKVGDAIIWLERIRRQEKAGILGEPAVQVLPREVFHYMDGNDVPRTIIPLDCLILILERVAETYPEVKL